MGKRIRKPKKEKNIKGNSEQEKHYVLNVQDSTITGKTNFGK